MRYQITDGTVSAGGKEILSHINFEIKGNEKIAVTGQNGAGKTTFLRLLMGEIDLDRDDRREGTGRGGILASEHFTAALLRQNCDFEEGKTVEDFCMKDCPAEEMYSRERYLYEMEFDRLFTGLGFRKEEKKKELQYFSGGQQTKISLIHLLLQKPDLLLLDEPTNHLDLKTVEWLEDYLKNYDRAIVMVSHDRYFLDRVAEIVYELENGKMTRYTGGYTSYRQQKLKNIRARTKEWEAQQKEIERLNELIEKFKHKPKKAAFARSRKTILERMDRVGKPREDEAHLFTGPIEPRQAGSKWAVEMEHLVAGYEEPIVNLSLRIRRGQKIGIIGENGIGKSTLLKTIAGILPPLDGKCLLGNGVEAGYFDQMSASIQSELSVLEHFKNRFPGMTEKEVRQTLGAYLFPGGKAGIKVSGLSGGEKARLLLCELLTAGPNLLLLDEPTNHMDIPARETLESAFRAYTGTILFVSHDRYFIREVADAILVLEDNAAFYYPFGYEHYMERRAGSGADRRDRAGLIEAENQALIAGIRAVPKAERYRLREIPTETAYDEWRMILKTEELEKARKAYEAALLEPNEDLWQQEEEKWLQQCLEWYDLAVETGLIMKNL